MQTDYIDECVKSNLPVKVIMLNGFQMDCRIIENGDVYVIVKANHDEKLVYKHAISTIEHR